MSRKPQRPTPPPPSFKKPGARRPASPSRKSVPAPPAPTQGLRRWVELRSRPLMLALTRMPRWIVPLLLTVLLLVGLVFDNLAGTIALGVVFIFLGWLVYLSWPVLATPARLVRLAVLAMVAGVLVVRVGL